MSRLIKFRAWDKDFEMMFYSNSSDDPLNMKGERTHILCGYDKPEGHLSHFFSEKFPIMQFTGLNDSKGKEIYEGDIVDGINIDGETYPMGEVFFDSGCFCIKTKSCDHDYEPCLYEAWAEKIFVVGNIYENPNLLIKGEKYGRRK